MSVLCRRWRRILPCLTGALIVAGPACNGGERSTGSGREPSVGAGKAVSPAAAREVERLRALPYVGFKAPRPGETGSGVVRRGTGSWPGFDFFVNPTLGVAVLMDDRGRPVNVWRGDPRARWPSAELLGSGELLVTGITSGAADPDEMTAGRFLLKLGWRGETVWRREIPAHHDVDVWPDGRLLTLTARHRVVPAIHPTSPVRDNEIALLSPEGEGIASLSLYDLFAGAPNLAPLQIAQPRGRAQDIDLFHANSVERVDPAKGLPSHPLYAADNVLVCVRHQDVIIMASWATRRLVWAWGREELSSPHDATLLPGGHILVFDNGLSRGRSRVVELDPLTGVVVWSWEAPPGQSFFTPSRGSCQRLPNGNTLIGESDSGRAFEVSRDGQVVWEFLNPIRNERGERAAFYRMTRIEPGIIDAIVARHGPGRVPRTIAALFGE